MMVSPAANRQCSPIMQKLHGGLLAETPRLATHMRQQTQIPWPHCNGAHFGAYCDWLDLANRISRSLLTVSAAFSSVCA